MRRILAVAAGAAVVVAAAARWPNLPTRLPVLCLYRRMTGRPCPACGTSRGLWRLLAGDLRGAWRANPVTPLVAVVAAYGVWTWIRGAGAVSTPRADSG